MFILVVFFSVFVNNAVWRNLILKWSHWKKNRIWIYWNIKILCVGKFVRNLKIWNFNCGHLTQLGIFLCDHSDIFFMLLLILFIVVFISAKKKVVEFKFKIWNKFGKVTMYFKWLFCFSYNFYVEFEIIWKRCVSIWSGCFGLYIFFEFVLSWFGCLFQKLGKFWKMETERGKKIKRPK